MKLKKNTDHSISSLFSLLLFGIFVLFLMLMLLFSARIYQQTVKQTDSDSELGTAITYLTTKFRQHDQAEKFFPGLWTVPLHYVSGIKLTKKTTPPTST